MEQYVKGFQRFHASEEVRPVTSCKFLLIPFTARLAREKERLREGSLSFAACSDNNDCKWEAFKCGVFGMCDGKMASLMTSLQSTETAKQVLYWGDISDPLPCLAKD